ncbi:isoleucine--tRNA ligase [Candidatus Mycoplasma mahonii]|uniref:isoleucine--tRNA ligase n=1 Tax=Candidatus Mycoplasma mahonii TaxID=3004105 RepID=UPI0026F0839A|nr:isoleucine--tRNA ligase [Candidatus Mycoplasma mahonii]WKX02290.1 isoleucine--tRNA ligase [Candidatus Mycoplasma mahonii]
MNENKREWKDTLLMPRTDFSMKANLQVKEPEQRQAWLDQKIYQKALEQNKDNPKFILHDGPTYSNGSLHVGHALNKILKDIIIRHKTMKGFYTPYIPGWDTHGLPVENKMLETLKMSKDDMDKITLRKKAAEYTLGQIEIQKEQFKAMQLFTDFSQTYVTLDKNFEVGQLKLFKKMALEGLIYKGLKPVYWSPSSMSALAEAEVEYEDIRSPQIIVAFEIIKGNEYLQAGDYLTIMTTTPWTLPANSGVAVGVNFDYDIVEANGNKYVIASALTSAIAELAKWEDFNLLKTVKGSDLVGLTYQRPISKLEAPVVAGHHVTTATGTGLVHMAPLFGEDDYIIGKEQQLDMIMHVLDDGSLDDQAGKYANMFYLDANKGIGLDLAQEGNMLSLKFVKHSHPHDWRTHKPVIFRGTPQWFVSIDKIKQDILNQLAQVKSFPDWGVARLAKMIEDRTDWTISRQRTWGVPIIIFYDEHDEVVMKEEIFDHVIALVQKHGTDVWWEKTTDELLPKSYRGNNWTKEMDIMDVWFDSGSSHIYIAQKLGVEQFDLYLEGSDQYRGWFNSSLINGVAYNGKSPYKGLITHGFVLDGKKMKMSKSKGNVIDPLKVINKNGAETLRLWTANSEYTSDVAISEDIIKQNIEIYRRIRNTISFMLGNLHNYDESKKHELSGVHLLINEQLNNLIAEVATYYDHYKFQNVVKSINQFMIQLSSFYFDFAKDSLYCDAADDHQRQQFQTNIWLIVNFFMKALAPILPTTMEEAYKEFNKQDKKESIFLETYGKNETAQKTIHKNNWVAFFKLRDDVNHAIEESIKQGFIKRSNEAIIHLPLHHISHLNIPSYELGRMLMVAKVFDANEIKVATFESLKCHRCWNHFYPQEINNDICPRCQKVAP